MNWKLRTERDENRRRDVYGTNVWIMVLHRREILLIHVVTKGSMCVDKKNLPRLKV